MLLDQKAVTSCTVFTGQVMGKEIITIEGLEKDGELDVLQKAFIAVSYTHLPILRILLHLLFKFQASGAARSI